MVIQFPNQDIRDLIREVNEDIKKLLEASGHEQNKILDVINSAPWKKMAADAADALERYKNQLNSHISNINPSVYHNNTVFRSVRSKYDKSPLSVEGSMQKENRYNRKGDPTLYFSEFHETTVKELPIDYFSNYQITTFSSEIGLKKVLDMANNDHSSIIPNGINLLKIGIDFYRDILEVMPITWIISDVIRDHGFEAIRYESVRDEGKYNLAVFPKNFLEGSFIRIIDPQDDQNPVEINASNIALLLCQHC